MRVFDRLLMVAVCIIGGVSCAAAQSVEPWLPISAQDLQMKDTPAGPGAPAIQLYVSYYKDDNAGFVLCYRRIKVLNDAGRKKYADVEIPLLPGESLKELKARTVHPDGSIAEFLDKPFEKTVYKTSRVKYLAKKFTLADVSIGSIVEYSYAITLPRHHIYPISGWFLQDELYTRKEHFRFQPFLGAVNVYTEWNTAFRKSQVTCSYQNETSAPVPEKKKDGLMELVLEDVAPFKDEDYMPPQADYRAAVLCYYGGHEFISPDSFWPESQKRITKYIEEFIGNPSAFRDDAASAVGAETDPEQKLRKLYARAQQIRNLSYERERTPEEEKRENLKPNSTAQDVLKHGYGTHSEIDAVFVGLARAAGFEASVLGVSDRQEHSFSKMILSLGQLNGVAVLIHVNGKDVLLDPGTRFCPYGVLSWKHSAVPALNFKTGGEFITTPPPPSTLMHRMADLDLAADGSAKGELTVALRGPEALEHRLEALQTDDAGRRKSFEDEVQAWLPGEATVKMTDSKGWDSVEDDLVARFTVDIPNFASVTGKRLIIPTYLFSTPRKGLFTIELRMYPITFPYPLTETDQVTVKWPDTYSLEEPPYRRKADLKYANYEISASAESKQLVTNRILRFDGLSFLPEKYPELRNFFTVVEAGDASHAVLEQAHAADAKNPQ